MQAFRVSCRTRNGSYEDVVAIIPLSNQSRIQAPAPVPSGIFRCKVVRNNKLQLAVMNMAKL